MNKSFLRLIVFMCVLSFLFPCIRPASAAPPTTSETDTSGLDISAKAAVLLEGSTGEILYAKNKDEQLVPASITKIMTLLLIYDTLASGKIKSEDVVTVSEFAASMGGSQVFLEPGETQTVDTMIRCISIASANDAAVAMAEHISGSEEAFVKKMNQRANELGMKNTHFMNCNGLDDTIESGHYTSAYDVALMSRELITRYPQISKHSTTWMDTITHVTKKGESEFGLTNTNKLVRTYSGITGLKTGSTSKAKYCLSATAKREGMDLIAVIMAAPDFRIRFSQAASLLDYGFANAYLYHDNQSDYKKKKIPIEGGTLATLTAQPESAFTKLFFRGEDISKVKTKIHYQTKLKAPIHKGDPVGSIDYYYQKKKIGSTRLLAEHKVPVAKLSDYFFRLLTRLFMTNNSI